MLTKIIRQAGILLSGNLLASVLNFLSVAISLKALGIESFGQVTLLQAYILVISLCFNPQAWQGLIRYFSIERDKAGLIVLTLKYDLICAVLGTCLAIGCAQFYADSFKLSEHSEILQWSSLYILFNQTSVAIGVLRYQERYKALALQSIISAVLFFGCAVVGHWKNLGVSYFVTTYLITLGLGVVFIQVLCGSYVVSILKSKNSATEALHGNWKKGFNRFNFTVHMTALADIPVKQLDNILVGAVVSVGATGAYRVIKQIATISTKVTGPLNQVLYPEVNSLLAEKAYRNVKSAMLKIIILLLIPSLVVVAFASISTNYWIPMLFSEELLVYKWHIIIFLLVHAVATAFTPIHPIFLALGYVKRLFIITLFSNAILCVGILLLGQQLGLLGVVIAISIQYLITIVFKLPQILRRLAKENDESITLHT
ncbi:lipopolysaccharide biosynthesis protein [Pseudoalteromonas xiamenensis]